MNILHAIASRFSARAFLDKPVPHDIIIKILEHAKLAPSGVNTQPWLVHIVEAKKKQEISAAILDQRIKNIAPNPDYTYYPKQWLEPYKSRRKDCGAALYKALHIDYHEKEKRLHAWNKNYTFFGAPTGFFIFIDKTLETGSWLDLGLFLQNFFLAARAFDLHTCPQASMAEYPDIIRNLLNVGEQFYLACGIALGYANIDKPVNQYRTSRIKQKEFCFWHE